MQRLRQIDIQANDLTFSTILARQSQRNGDKIYLRFEDRTFTYQEVDLLTNRLANGFLSFGIGKGHHVAIMADNSPETLLSMFALSKIGAIICPLNTAAKGNLLVYLLTQADCEAVVVSSDYVSRLANALPLTPKVSRLVILPSGDTDDAGTILNNVVDSRSYKLLLEAPEHAPGISVHAEDIHGIFYTSGTTGPSKGIVTSHAQSLAFSLGRAEYLGLHHDDIVYSCLPLFHGNAFNAAALPALLADATLALSRRFSASRFWDDVRNTRATQLNLLSSMTNILWSQPESERDKQHELRQCTMVPVPSFARDFERRFAVEVVSSYSLTDFGQGTFLQPGYPPEKYRSAGQARPGVQIAILDDEDRILPAGQTGEICLRTDDPTLGGRRYYKMPEETAEANRGGWFHTGDRGYLDADDFLYFVDRKKDAIRRRGENISSWEVEQVLAQHPAVAEVAVFPVRSDMSEDEVMAAVVCREGQTADPVDLIRFCERNMSYFMVPRFIEFLPDLPRTLTEKVQKHLLRDSAERRLGSDIWDREKAGVVLRR